MTRTEMALPQRPRFGETSRSDAWWMQPLSILLGLSIFIVYSTWAAFQGDHYRFAGGGADYLSPFYSPELLGDPTHSWFGARPGWWPGWLPFSPAFLILWAPAGFRITCYYYRGAYYKGFWADPPACAVGEPRTGYRGENSLPLILQNVHRWFLYLAIGFIGILSWDVWRAMWFERAGGGGTEWGIGLGTIVLLLNVVLLGGYTMGCHSLRHLVGGRLDCIAKHRARARAYDCVSCLNRRHILWAWLSLFSVGFTDLYVRLCAMGIWTDWRLF